MARPGLSKSRIVAHQQCPKRLWLHVNRPELMAVSDNTERSFQIGYEVGKVAQGLYPDGILIRNDDDLRAALAATQAALLVHPKCPIFEATFEHDGVLVRVDLLLPSAHGYRMVEVKSSTCVKPYHVVDCAIQAWVLRQNGIVLTGIELAHIDTSFVYQGDGNYQGLLHHTLLDEEVSALREQVPLWMANACSTLAGDEPFIAPGAHCGDPFECPFKIGCNKNLPQPELPTYSPNVFSHMCSAKKDDLRGQGFVDARDVPPNELTSTQQRIQRVSQSGKAELTQEAAHALAALPYPRYYLNFETIHLAVPRWAHTSPYRTQVPFAWSCHVEDEAGHVKHAMFLEVSDHDPCRACAETMLAALGNAGPVFVYSQSFERGRIAELAELYSDLAPALLAIHARIVDLLLLTKISYYHPNMRGSWSIRAVLPTIANDLDKKRLDAGDGGAAQDAFREILHPDTPESRKQALTQGLRDYCTLNTLAMLRLAWVLAGYVDLPKRYPPAVNRFAVPKGGNILLAPSNKPRTPHPDPFFEAAEGKLRNYFMRENVSLINQHVSISLLQRIMHIGFNRTLDVMQHLIDEGVLSPSNSGKIDL